MAYRRVRNHVNTVGATSGAETANSSRAPEYTSRKGPGSAYDKWNVSVVICDTGIP
jgi:hypothetical protein